MTTIDDRIAAVADLGIRLEDAARFLAEAAAAEGERIAQRAAAVAETAQRALAQVQDLHKALAYARRPNGTMVTLEYECSYVKREPRKVECIRRTEASVFVLWPESKLVKRYRLSDGRKAERRSSGGDWRIAAADLERIRAMPAGENEVSKALKKLEATR